MEYQEYYSQVNEAAKRVDRGDYDSALKSFQQLLDSDISDLDKTNTCINMAVIFEKKGDTGEALRCYDKGRGFEKSHHRFLALEAKAGLYWRLGRYPEAARIYQDLLQKKFLTEEDKYRIGQILNTLS